MLMVVALVRILTRVFFFVFFTFFLTKCKFFYKFNLVLRVLDLGSRIQEVPTIPARGVWGAKPPSLVHSLV